MLAKAEKVGTLVIVIFVFSNAYFTKSAVKVSDYNTTIFKHI